MIIHGARPSPFVRKVIVFAAEKGIDVEVQPAGFRSEEHTSELQSH